MCVRSTARTPQRHPGTFRTKCRSFSQLIKLLQNIGSLAAYPFSPYISDGLGRRSAIFLGALIMIAATVLQTASQSVGMFIGARYVPFLAFRYPSDELTANRFLIGFGLTFAAAAAPLLVTEVAYPSQRAQATSMYNTLWYLGSIM